MSICPRHREAYGIRWRCQKKLCSVPPEWSVHKKKELKGDQGLTLSQSQLLYRLTSVLVPAASRKSNFFSSSISIPVLNLACFGLFMVLILLFPAICKQCQLFLTIESKSFDTCFIAVFCIFLFRCFHLTMANVSYLNTFTVEGKKIPNSISN